MKKYIALNQNNSINANFLEIKTSYSKGGRAIYTGGTLTRGFYIDITPVNISNGLINYIYPGGICALIEPVNRYSVKKENTINNDVFSALDKIDIAMNDTPFTELVNRVLENNNLTLA